MNESRQSSAVAETETTVPDAPDAVAFDAAIEPPARNPVHIYDARLDHFAARTNDLVNEGCQPLSLSMYGDPGHALFAGVFDKRPGPPLRWTLGSTISDFLWEYTNNQRNRGLLSRQRHVTVRVRPVGLAIVHEVRVDLPGRDGAKRLSGRRSAPAGRGPRLHHRPRLSICRAAERLAVVQQVRESVPCRVRCGGVSCGRRTQQDRRRKLQRGVRTVDAHASCAGISVP